MLVGEKKRVDISRRMNETQYHFPPRGHLIQCRQNLLSRYIICSRSQTMENNVWMIDWNVSWSLISIPIILFRYWSEFQNHSFSLSIEKKNDYYNLEWKCATFTRNECCADHSDSKVFGYYACTYWRCNLLKRFWTITRDLSILERFFCGLPNNLFYIQFILFFSLSFFVFFYIFHCMISAHILSNYRITLDVF